MRLNRRQTLTALGGPWRFPMCAPPGRSRELSMSTTGPTTSVKQRLRISSRNRDRRCLRHVLFAEEMQAKMLAGSTGYDVCFTAGISQPQMITAGVYAKLDRSRLTGWGNLDPELLRIMDGWDAGSAYSVPYMWGPSGSPSTNRYGERAFARRRHAEHGHHLQARELPRSLRIAASRFRQPDRHHADGTALSGPRWRYD